FFNATANTALYTLSLHDALPIWAKLVHAAAGQLRRGDAHHFRAGHPDVSQQNLLYARQFEKHEVFRRDRAPVGPGTSRLLPAVLDRKSTRLNSSHDQISYAVFCL